MHRLIAEVKSYDGMCEPLKPVPAFLKEVHAMNDEFNSIKSEKFKWKRKF